LAIAITGFATLQDRETALRSGFDEHVAKPVQIESLLMSAPAEDKSGADQAGNQYEQAALMLIPPFGRWGVTLFAASLGIGCLGAAIEIALNLAYTVSQGLGWNWSEDLKPSSNSRFALVYTLIIGLAAVPLIFGVDPIKVTVMSMALTSATLPLAIVPFLFLMNDPIYLGKDGNGWISNTVVGVVILISFVLALVSIPLEIMGG